MATLRKLPTMVAVAAFTAALSGCGGNDGKLVRDLEADVEAAVARATAAEAAKALAEMAQAEAETAATMASSARMTAEQERDTATAAQMMAEEARTAAEMRQSEAEMAQAMAEEAQAEAEMAQAEAEMARETARTAQAAAEAAQAAAQAAAMSARTDEQDARAAERAARMAETAALTRAAAAEAKSTAAEAAKIAAETERTKAETAQKAAEAARMAAEADKMAAETAQKAAEAAQAAAKAAQAAAEADKMKAEADKMAAEAAQKAAEDDLTEANNTIAKLLEELDRDRDAEEARRVAVAISSNRVGRANLMRIGANGRLVEGNTVLNHTTSPTGRPPNVILPGAVVMGSQLPFLSPDNPSTTGVEDPRGHLTTVSASRKPDGMLNVSVSLPTTVDSVNYSVGKSMVSPGDEWNSATLERSTPGGNETIMLYTDISAPTSTSFVYDNSSIVGTGSISTYSANSLVTLMVDGSNRPVAGTADIGLVSPPAPGSTINVQAPPTGGNGTALLRGSFGGVSGAYVCANRCQFTASASGVLSLTASGFTTTNRSGLDVYFLPDDTSARFLSADSSYRYFGWWINEPNSSGDIYQVEGFSGSSGDTSDTTGGGDGAVMLSHNIAGTATYSGRAAGRYVARTIPQRGVITDGEVGSFTADATLNADFGNTSDQNAGSISGRVDNFNMDGDTDASGWVLRLNRASLGRGTTTNFSGDTSVSVTSDQSTVTLGKWEGRFFDGATATTSGTPGTVIGTFDSHDALANITGAFGAKKQ